MLDELIAIALKAGEVIMPIYDRQDLGVKTKGDSSPVTEGPHSPAEFW